MLNLFDIASPDLRPRLIRCLFLWLVISNTAGAVEWGDVDGKDITLFLPGQMSWEWVLSPDTHIAAAMVKQGRNCRMCHNNQENILGSKILANKVSEPQPLPGAPGSISLNVKMAHDSERIYMRFNWKAPEYTGNIVMNPEVEARLSLLLDDGHVQEASLAGCWSACHSDNSGMSKATAGKQITKYIVQSRTNTDTTVLRNDGVFLESWELELKQGADPVVVDGYVLEERSHNEQPQLQAEAQFENGYWTVTLSRALVGAGPLHKDIVPDKTYSLGFALHSNHSAGRYHYVSLEYSLALDGGDADFTVLN